MAIVKCRFNKNAQRLQAYITNERNNLHSDEEELHISSNMLLEEKEAYKEMLQNQEIHNSKTSNQVIHITQAFSPEESKSLTPEEVNRIGLELMNKHFPNHKSLVVTHADRDHLHNHIMLDPVNTVTGKRIYNKMSFQDTLREKSDLLLLSKGYSIIEKKEGQRLSDKAHIIQAKNKNSYIFDLREKALFAQKYARNFSEHKLIMEDFGIEVRLTNKTISYKYPGTQKRKRANKLDPSLTFENMKHVQNENLKKMESRPIKEIVEKDQEYQRLKDSTVQIRKSQPKKIPNLKKQKRERYKQYILGTAQRYIDLQKKGKVLIINEQNEKFFLSREDKEFRISKIKSGMDIRNITSYLVHSAYADAIYDLSRPEKTPKRISQLDKSELALIENLIDLNDGIKEIYLPDHIYSKSAHQQANKHLGKQIFKVSEAEKQIFQTLKLI